MTGRPESPDLTNPRSERVRTVRSLSGRSARQRHGLYLVEGPQAVREAVRWTPADIRDVYLSRPAADRHPEIAQDARAAGLSVRFASADVVEEMSGDSQGVLAVVRVREASLEAVLAAGPRLVAVLVAVRDPGNAGTVIRVADAAGADAVVVTRASVDVYNPKAVRAAAGSLAHVPVVTQTGLPDVVAALRGAGLTVLAADGAGEHDVDALLDAASATGLLGAARLSPVPDLGAPTAWFFGNEAWGLPADDVALADAAVRVPIHGRAESLNLAAAAAVCLYASARAQRSRS